MGTVTLIRPDGSTLLVPDQDAEQLKVLGYTPETPEQTLQRNQEIGKEDYYTSFGQKVTTGVEGLVSGATLGLSNLVFDDDETKDRARYNPGFRLAGELGGAFISPAGMFGDVAEGLALESGVGRLGASAARGVTEGAIFGGAGALTDAKLKGDPVTTEAILAGMGWGGIYGGGLGALAGAAGARLERAEAKAAEQEILEKEATQRVVREQGAQRAVLEEHWQQLRGAVDEVRKASQEAVDQTQASVEDLRSTEVPLKERVKQAAGAADQGKEYLDSVVSTGLMKQPGVRPAVRQAFDAYQKVVKTSEAGDYAGFEINFARFKEKLNKVAEVSASTAPEMQTFVLRNISKAQSAAKEVSALAGVAEATKSMPATIDGFRGLRTETAEKIGAALDNFNSKAGAELEGVRTSMTTALQNFQEKLGVDIGGTPGTQFRGLVETLKGAGKVKAKEEASELIKGKPSWWDKTKHTLYKRSVAHGAGYAGESVAERLGAKGVARFMAYDIAKNMAYGLLNIKGAVLGTISDQVSKWTPALLKAQKAIGPKIEPLAVRLNSTLDERRKSRQELMQDRIREISQAAPTVPDTLYKGVQPLSVFHPELAQALHSQSLAQFKMLYDQMPKDPGLAYSALQTLWKPGDVETEKFARTYEVYHDPVGVMTRALQTGQITPEAAQALQEFWPETWQHFRVEMLTKVSDPQVWKRLGYANQVNLGFMLGVPLHSTMTPQFISQQMQMFTQRSQLKPMGPQIGAEQGSGAGGGRPAENREATQAQRITEH